MVKPRICTIHVRIPADLYAQIQAEADEEDITTSDVVRRILVRWYRQLHVGQPTGAPVTADPDPTRKE